MYLFCWCLSEFHPSIDLSFAFLLPTTTFHVAGVGWSVQVHSLSGGLSKTSSAAWTNAYFKCSSPSLATLFLCLSLEFCRILRWPKSQFGWRRLRNLCILQLDYVFAYVTLIKYTYLFTYYLRTIHNIFIQCKTWSGEILCSIMAHNRRREMFNCSGQEMKIFGLFLKFWNFSNIWKFRFLDNYKL